MRCIACRGRRAPARHEEEQGMAHQRETETVVVDELAANHPNREVHTLRSAKRSAVRTARRGTVTGEVDACGA